MFKRIFIWLFVFFNIGTNAQEVFTLYKTKKIIATNDTINLTKTSINSSFFSIKDKNNSIIDTVFYKIDFKKGLLTFNENYIQTKDTLTINYLNFPDFLTKEYSVYDQNRVITNNLGQSIYQIESNSGIKYKPFDGLNTSGNLTRGITVGNNQNSVVNSNLDLQISGKLSDKITLKASIQDSNLPLRNGGYSQKIGEFDQIFIELASDKWSFRAGDLFLENRKSNFLNFNKKTQGLLANINFGKPENNTTLFAGAAIVRGKYSKSNFIGQEGNQGPYKLRGENGELFILVIPGSERVFVNGILKKLGDTADYIMDYNAGEIKFTTQFPITSEMRIVIEYQYTDQNYTRFVSYAGANHETKKWSLGSYLYSENDNKNQPIQQNLSTEQALILSNAGDAISLMNAPSAYQDVYSTNKILYKKTIVSGAEVFQYSNNPTDVLYNVKFSLVGTNSGNYVISNASAIGKIYQYVAPIAGVLQGNYEPVIRLIAPTQIQMATVLGKYNPTEKTILDFEMSVSNNDKNLFSSIDDNDNQGVAAKINFKQRLFSNKWKIDGFGNYQLVQKNFTTIERLFTIEFNRDWNLTNFSGNQSYLFTGLDFSLPTKGKLTYQFENLSFTESFSGKRHKIDGLFRFNNFMVQNSGSYLNSNGLYSKSEFIRNQFQARLHHKKNWIGSSFRLENNQETLQSTNQLSNLSQKFIEFGGFAGRGDSTKVFVEIGFLKRANDSLQNGFLKPVNQSNSYYLNSKMIKNEKNDLSIFVNYRTLAFENPSIKNQNSLNSKLLHNARFFNDLIQTTTVFETTSGTIAQQEFTYLEVAPGLGVYLWNDYNQNGIQELQEFEVSPFPDQAKYVRVFLPSQIFVKTHQNRFSESLILNPNHWQNEKGFKKVLSYFYNQTSYSVDRKEIRNSDGFNLNPFKNSADLLGLNSNFRNSLYYNRGKQLHSITYSYLNNHSKNLLSVGSVENSSAAHQLQYVHLIQKLWLLSFDAKTIQSSAKTENYSSRNFDLKVYKIAPKLSYLFNQTSNLEVFFETQNQKNTLGQETLQQQRFGAAFAFANDKKFSISGEFSLYDNRFVGNELSPVAFQMLEGLQAGKNTTWRLLLQKNLTQYLQLSLNYQGRKSETSQTIHTGNVQLRASF
jgi:hypothetical protein